MTEPTHSFELGPVQQNVPLPNKFDALTAVRSLVQQLKLGESFEFRALPIKDPQGVTYHGHGGYSYSRNSFLRLQNWARPHGIKLTARWLESDSEIQVARIWRVA